VEKKRRAAVRRSYWVKIKFSKRKGKQTAAVDTEATPHEGKATRVEKGEGTRQEKTIYSADKRRPSENPRRGAEDSEANKGTYEEILSSSGVISLKGVVQQRVREKHTERKGIIDSRKGSGKEDFQAIFGADSTRQEDLDRRRAAKTGPRMRQSQRRTGGAAYGQSYSIQLN